MIARIWRGAVPASKARAYLDLVRTVALPECLAIQGNRGGWCLHRSDDDAMQFQMLSFWDDVEAIKRFAGGDDDIASDREFDSDHLADLDARVEHYEVHSDGSSEESDATRGRNRGDEKMVARVWRGVVRVEKAEDYYRYLAGFGFQDYRTYPGNQGVHLLRRTEEARAHFLLLSFWTSLEAIVAYAGADIAKARYYPYDLECLIDPPASVEHYEVISGVAAGAR